MAEDYCQFLKIEVSVWCALINSTTDDGARCARCPAQVREVASQAASWLIPVLT